MEFNVIRAGYNIFDVFEGKQWSSWSRLKSGRHDVYVAAGDRLPHPVTKALAAAINPKLRQQLITLN